MTAFVTGGSRGIGREIVLQFVREGHDCAFTYRGNREAAEQTLAAAREAAAEASQGTPAAPASPGEPASRGATGRTRAPRVQAYQLDVRDPAAVERVSEQAIEEFGDVHYVVNNAGVVRNNAAALMSNEEWDEVIATNLSGPFYVTRSFLLHFLSNKFGRFIHLSSIAGAGASGQANYAASKAGLVGLSKTVAKEYGQKGITSNIVVVGYVETSMTNDHLVEEWHDIWMRYCPMKRVGTADEIASLVLYLTSEPAGFINGEVIHVAGGLTYAP